MTKEVAREVAESTWSSHALSQKTDELLCLASSNNFALYRVVREKRFWPFYLSVEASGQTQFILFVAATKFFDA